MKGRYDDIVSRVADPILWYDEHGVPRYVPFASRRKADIPADEAALVEVVCQRCLRGVLVCCSGVQRRDGSRRLVVEAIRADEWGSMVIRHATPPRRSASPAWMAAPPVSPR